MMEMQEFSLLFELLFSLLCTFVAFFTFSGILCAFFAVERNTSSSHFVGGKRDVGILC